MNKYLTDNDIIFILNKCGFNKAASGYIGSSIPEKKARNAMTTMNIPYGVNILGLFDDTVFGSGKDGFCICSNGIYFRVYLDQPKVIFYNQLPDMKLSRTSTGITAGSYNIKFTSGTDLFYKLVEFLQTYLKLDFIEINNGTFSVNLNHLIEIFNKNDYVHSLNEVQEIEKYFTEAELSGNMSFYQIKVYTLLELNEMDKANHAIRMFESMFNNDAGKVFINKIKENYSVKMKENNKAAYQQLTAYLKQRLEQLSFCQDVLVEAKNYYHQKNYRQGLELLELIPSEIKKASNSMIIDYYQLCIGCCVEMEHVNTADQYLIGLKEDLPEQTELFGQLSKQINDKKAVIEERYLNEKRGEYKEQLCIAKMYEKYGEFESAYDTISLAGEELPVKLQEERRENLIYQTELLISLYNYDEARKLIKKEDQQNELYNRLSKMIDTHEKEHIEDNYQHKYHETNRLLKLGKIEKAELTLKKAMLLKETFEAKCCEINISILKLDFIQTRLLLDKLKAEAEVKFDIDPGTAKETLLLLETEYRKMISCIADILKKEMSEGNLGFFTENEDRYKAFRDNDGNNLTMLSFLYFNSEIIKTMRDKQQLNEVNHAGHGVTVLAAAKLDPADFSAYLSDIIDNDEITDYLTGERKEENSETGTYNYIMNEISKAFSGLKLNEYGNEAESMEILKLLLDKEYEVIYKNLQNILCCTINEALREEHKISLMRKKKDTEEKKAEDKLKSDKKLEDINLRKCNEIARLEQEFIEYNIRQQVGEKGEFEKDEEFKLRRNAFIEENKEQLRNQTCIKWKDKYDKLISKYRMEEKQARIEAENQKYTLQRVEKEIREFETAKETSIKYFLFSPNGLELEKYNANEEYFDIQYFGAKGRLSVPIDVAKKFKDEYAQASSIEGTTDIIDLPSGFELSHQVSVHYNGMEYTCTVQREWKYIDVTPLTDEIQLIKINHNQKVEEKLKSMEELEYDPEEMDDFKDETDGESDDYDNTEYEEEEEVSDHTEERDNNPSVKEGSGGLLNSPEMLELIDSIGQMTRAERVEFKNNLSSLGFDPMKIVKINLAVNRIESKELTAMCADINTMPLDKLKKLKDKIERGNYNPAISEDFIDEIEELIEQKETTAE